MSKGDVIYWLWLLGGVSTAMWLGDVRDSNDQKLGELGWMATFGIIAAWPLLMAALAVCFFGYWSWQLLVRLWRGCKAFVREVSAKPDSGKPA